MVAWGNALQAALDSSGVEGVQHALGLVDTEWGSDLPAQKWGNIPNVSACAWNVAAFLKSASTDH